MLAQRNAQGQQIADPSKFPNGFQAVTEYIHSLGMKSGLCVLRKQLECEAPEHLTRRSAQLHCQGPPHVPEARCKLRARVYRRGAVGVVGHRLCQGWAGSAAAAAAAGAPQP